MMTTLFDYLKQTQRFIRDAKQELINPYDLTEYVNRARREVAMRTASVRLLTPITGSIIAYSITNAGAGYTAPTVTVSAPDFPSGYPPFPNGSQATAAATEISGSISAVHSTYGGYGYFEPVVTINDPTGTGATAQPILSGINALYEGQEVYNFSSVNLSAYPGFGSVYLVRSVSIIYADYRYSLPMYSFSTYQAMIRQYPFQYQYVPTFGSQFGRGSSGSLYMYPIASQTYQMEWDCSCLPLDLLTDQDVEAIPEPWTDSVPFLAAYFAFLEIQNLNAAEYYKKQFDEWISRQSKYVQPGRVVNPYGRY